jgi:hypothetical protein
VKKVARDPKLTKRRVSEGKSEASIPKTDFRALLGIGLKVPINPNPKFTNEDQLWEKDAN